MGLRIWNLLTDLYDHSQLADNWAKVDYHDHSPGKGVQIPTDGLADGAVTGPKLATAIDPSGAYESSKPVQRFAASFGPGAAAGTYPMTLNFANATGSPWEALGRAFYLNPADWVASGRTLRYMIRGAIITNAVAPGNSYAFQLNPVSTWGGASGAVPTITALSAAVTGSATGAITTPAAGGPSAQVSSEFDAPAAGWYTLSVVLSGASSAANSTIVSHATLHAKQV